MQVIAYGSAPEQHAELWAPSGDAGSPRPSPLVVLIHGGFWRARYAADLMHPLAADLVASGYAVANLEYRRVGSNGGDPLATLLDVRSGVDAVGAAADAKEVDLGRIALIGHSAGGHLALWLGGQWLDDSDGRDRRVDSSRLALQPKIIIGQAAVSDLVRAAHERLGDGATQDFLGGEPGSEPRRYLSAQPRLDADSMHLVHGDRDDTVPVAHSTEAVDVQGRPLPCTVVEGADHMAVIDPASAAWAVQRNLLDAVMKPPRPATGS